MSNSIKTIVIKRCSYNDNWEKLHIFVKMFNGEMKLFDSENEPDRSEDEALSDLMDNFAREFNSENFRRKIIHEFRQMRGPDYSGDYTVLPGGALHRHCIIYDASEEPHFSCKMTKILLNRRQKKTKFLTLN